MKKSLVTALALSLLGSTASATPKDEVPDALEKRLAALTPEGYTVVDSPTTTATSAIGSVSVISLPWWIYILKPTWQCKRWDLSVCPSSELANPAYRHILIMPSGYTEEDRSAFWTDFDTIVTAMSNSGTTWSTVKRDRIRYIGYFTGGGALGTPEAAFGGAVMAHPIRDYALTLNLDAVKAKVDEIRLNVLPSLRPMGVLTILNDFQADITANASPPSFLGGSYGIAKMNREDLKNGYIATHELGHAALNFLDEYVEGGMENLNIRSIDAATPLVLFDGTWPGFVRAISDLFGVYDYNLSEILANNGNVNVATSSVPSTVYSPISAPQQFAYEGGMFFGRGTFHMAGNNLMNGSRVQRGPDDTFAYAHSGSQWALINTAFGDNPYRANDRLRTAGPKDGWWGELGGTTVVMMFDGDKRNHFHATQHYVVQVGWWERVWFTSWWGPFPYPDYRDEWRTAQKNVTPGNRKIELKATSLYGLANLTQSVLCGVGVTEVPKPDGGKFKLCDTPLSQIASAFLPTFSFATPYTEATVPASQWFTNYWWRFATWNGYTYSGWTGWSNFYRSF